MNPPLPHTRTQTIPQAATVMGAIKYLSFYDVWFDTFQTACIRFWLTGIISDEKYRNVTLEYDSLLHQRAGKRQIHFVIHEWSRIGWWETMRVSVWTSNSEWVITVSLSHTEVHLVIPLL